MKRARTKAVKAWAVEADGSLWLATVEHRWEVAKEQIMPLSEMYPGIKRWRLVRVEIRVLERKKRGGKGK